MIPRIGAFEVSYKGIIVFSKLMTQVWPYVPAVAKQIGRMITEADAGTSDAVLRQKYQTDGTH